MTPWLLLFLIVQLLLLVYVVFGAVRVTGTMRLIPRDPVWWQGREAALDLVVNQRATVWLPWHWMHAHRRQTLQMFRGATDVVWLDGPHFQRIAPWKTRGGE